MSRGVSISLSTAVVLAACGGTNAALFTGAAADAGDDAPVDASADASIDTGADASSSADWVIALDGTKSPRRLTPALLGHYDISGALYRYDQVMPPLAGAMAPVGFHDWRIGLGRWEFGTQLLPALTDGTPCNFAGYPSEGLAPPGTTDLQLIAARDWFTDDGNPVSSGDIADDSRYALAYVRQAIDVATALGTTPYVSIDHMPRAFAANQTPSRTNAAGQDACGNSWVNAVSDVAPGDAYLSSPLFAQAVVGAVKRVVEGSGAEPPRDAPYWEFWNEPELQYAWQQAYDPGFKKFFDAAVQVLVLLDQYRQQSGKPLHFGLASFANASTAAQVIATFDAASTPPPVDFFSFHAYLNDPLAIVANIQQATDARAASEHYANAELSLSEWGPDLSSPPDPSTMDLPLLEATVVARGATLGLDRTYHALFWDFFPGTPSSLALLDHAEHPKPLYRAYELLAGLIGAGADRLVVSGAPDGSLDSGEGAVIAASDASGTRVLLVNRASEPRSASFVVNGGAVTPARVRSFDDPASAVHDVAPSAVVAVPARSLVLAYL